MDDARLIREIFDRIQATPEADRAALRARIVRAVRGEVPHGVPWQEDDCMTKSMTLQARAERGREQLARRRDEESRARAARFEALVKAVRLDLEPELLPYAEHIGEQPETPDDFHLWLEIPEYAPLVAVYFWHQGAWKRGRFAWAGRTSALWGVVPYPDAEGGDWLGAETLEEALALATDCWPSHLVLPAKQPRRGWWKRLWDWAVLRCGVGAVGEFE